MEKRKLISKKTWNPRTKKERQEFIMIYGLQYWSITTKKYLVNDKDIEIESVMNPRNVKVWDQFNISISADGEVHQNDDKYSKFIE